jgi:GNAT superfamily N-acetyltransferase
MTLLGQLVGKARVATVAAVAASTESYAVGQDTIRFAYRDLCDDDVALVFSSWCHQILRCRPFSLMTRGMFASYKHDVLEPLLRRVGGTAAVAIDAPEVIFGYCVREPDDRVLHMLYVRAPHRRKKIGGHLLARVFPELGKKPIHYTHPTRFVRPNRDRWLLVHAPRYLEDR